jgi:uncharacterized protein
VVIADTSALYAAYNRREAHHDRVRGAIDPDVPLVIAPGVVTELDHLLLARDGIGAEVFVLDELAGGAYVLPTMSTVDLRAARDVTVRYQDLAIGLTDATLVVLAERFDTRRILTLDHRHFSVVEPLQGGRFELLP